LGFLLPASQSTLTVTRDSIAGLLPWQEKFPNKKINGAGVTCQSNVAECQDDYSSNHYLCLREVIMDLQIKLFSGLDRGNHVIIITRGSIDIEGFREIFRNVVNTTRSLIDCKVLIDLQDATYKLEPGDIHAFADNLRPEYWPPTNRVALVSEPDPQDYRQLCVLSTFLSNRAIKNAVFKDTRTAVSWLADAM
jgi:hypothetical protein